MILGPSIHFANADGIDNGDVSTSQLYADLAAGKDKEVPPTSFTAFADVSLNDYLSDTMNMALISRSETSHPRST